MPPFEATREKPQWEYAYDVFAVAESGETVTYEKLGSVLKFSPVSQRSRIQQIVHKVAPKLLENKRIALEAVPNVGYRVVRSNEHVGLARKHQSKASNSLSRGSSVVAHVDLNELTEVEKSLVFAVGQALAFQREHMQRLDVRQSKLEKVLKNVSTTQSEQSSELTDQSERISRLEARLKRFDQTE